MVLINFFNVYPYHEKLEEAIKSVLNNLEINEFDNVLIMNFIEFICDPLTSNSTASFRDAGFYNQILDYNLEDLNAKDVKNYIYHVDFETAKWKVCKEDDLTLILENSIWKKFFINSDNIIKHYGYNEELYQLCCVFRSLRNFARRLEYLCKNKDIYYARYNSYGSAIEEQPINYLYCTFNNLENLLYKNSITHKFYDFLKIRILPKMHSSWIL